MSETLIDPDGNELTTGWRLNELRELSGLPDASLYDYLCRNMGYILIRMDPQCLTLRFNPGIVRAPSLAAVFYRTAEYSDAIVKAELLGRGPPQAHTLTDGASAINFISRIVKLRSASESDRFFRQRAPIGQEMEHNLFRRLVKMLKRFSAPDDSEFVKAHLRRHFDGRYVVLKESSVPAVLVEMEFISNPAGERRLSGSRGRRRFAQAISEGVLNSGVLPLQPGP